MGIRLAIGGGFLGGIITWYYAYALYCGGQLRIAGKTNINGEPYSGGAILSIMFCVVIGVFGLAGVVPFVKFLNEAKIAGKLAFDVIDHECEVNVHKKGKVVEKE